MDTDPYPTVLNQILGIITNDAPLFSINPPEPASIVAIVIAMVALLASAFVSGSETAFFSVTSSDIDNVENEEKREALSRLLRKPERLLATILIANNFVNVTIVLLLNFALTQIMEFHSAALDFVFQSVILTFMLLLFGEILPKLYSNERRMKWVCSAVGPLSTLSRLLSPLTAVMARSTVIVNKVVTKRNEELSLDDLSHALEVTKVEGNNDKNMLEEILKFGGKTVSDIMTPRVDMTCVDWDASFDELLDMVRESGYSRMPVYVDTQDNIKGIIYAKDLLPYIGKQDASFKWQQLLRSAFFVPESRMIDDILEDFQKKKMHMAIVVDEYDEDEENYTRLSNDTYIFEGKTQLNDFCRITGLEEDTFDEVDEDAETIAGLLLNLKHDFPKEKELIEYRRCRFMVLSLDRRRIDKVKVRILPEKN